MRKKVFIDAGANKGQSIDHFINIIPDWKEYEIHLFEPDSRCSIYLSKYKDIPNIQLHKQAVWTHNGTVKLYLAGSPTGNSVVHEKVNVNINKYVEIACTDLSSFITEKYLPEDYIIVKIDIEGGEYEVLEHLLHTKAVTYIDELFVEFHKDKIPGKLSQNQHNNLIAKYKEKGFNNIEVPWEADTIKLNLLKLYTL